MDKNQKLRELQTRLAEKLQAVRSGDVASAAAWLAVEADGKKYLFPLSQSGAIFPYSLIQKVAHTQDWYLGVANMRGSLFGVVDFSGFVVGERRAARYELARSEARFVTLNSVLDVNCALFVDRLDGLRSTVSFSGSQDPAAPTGELLYIPVLGKRTLAAHLQILAALLLLSLVVLALVTFFALSQTKKVSQQLSATGQALMQSQRLAKSVSQAIVGAPQAFPDVKDSSEVLSRSVRALKAGDEQMRIEAVPAEAQVGAALRTISRQSSDLLEIAETVSSLKLQQNAAPTEISAAGQLVMLTQRIGKSANEFLTMEGVNPEAVFLLGKDLNSFKEITHGLQSGSAELRLAGTKDVQTLERLDALTKLYEQTRVQAGAILENLQGIVSAREAQVSILSDSEPMRRNLEELQTKLSGDSGLSPASILALVKAIQTDTQDAVAAMERSTQGVVEGAKLSDTAGTALIEIDRVSRRLAELIEQISKATSAEAASANLVADNIQHIFAVTEQTGEGTRATSQQVRELSQMANELRESVSRFKIA